MTFLVLCGDEALCARQLAHLLRQTATPTVERVDASAHAVADIVAVLLNQPLFSPAHQVVIDQIDKLTSSNLATVAAAAADSAHHVYATAKSLNAQQKRTLTDTLGDRLTIQDLPSLNGKRGHETVELLAVNAGVTLTRPVRQHLLDRVAHDPARLLSVIEQCRIGAISSPSVKQIDMLCGTADPAGVPWDLSDLLERGDVAGALDSCVNAVPLATLAYLGNRYQQMMRILEAGATTADAAADAAGSKSPAAAERLLRVARRLGPERLAAIIDDIANGDLLVKQHGVDGLRVVVGRIASHLPHTSPRTSPAASPAASQASTRR